MVSVAYICNYFKKKQTLFKNVFSVFYHSFMLCNNGRSLETDFKQWSEMKFLAMDLLSWAKDL